MKRLLILALTVALVFPVAAQSQKEKGPVLTLEKTSHDFGDIQQGDVVEHVFKFTNTGNEPLIITNVQASCGCTTPQWTKEPIMPGGKGEIKVGFNSAGRMGMQSKSLPVISNAINDVVINFSTNVLTKNPQ
ncbi:MAG: DUF1573 domain-containing protein [Cyclobacteriaceae bacterium]